MAYNRSMNEGKIHSKARLVAKILLPLACCLWLAFIFGNSLKVGEDSAKQSSLAVELVQTCVGWVAPNGWIATAQGEDLERLHHYVRKLAHFTEFAVLGVLACWCYFAYTSKQKWLWTALAGGVLVPFIDEGLQYFTAGRAAALTDVAIDTSGVVCGFAIAWLLWWGLQKILKKREEKHGREELRNRSNPI